MIDLETEFGARVAQRLKTELIIWLTTVRHDGIPQPNPVWFHWDGTSFLIYSQPDKPKLRNIARNPNVALHFNSDGEGGDIVIFAGQATLDESAPANHAVAAYVGKYREHMAAMGMTPEAFANDYSVAIRVTPTKVRGF